MLGRLPPSTGDRWHDAVTELRWSMAGEGLTADKLRHMTATLSLPAVRDALFGIPPERRLVTVYATIADAARTLGGSEPFTILRAALGIDYTGRARNLTDRRKDFAHVGDVRTVRDIEHRMVETLVTSLGGLPADERARPDQDAGVPRVWNVPVLHDPHFLGRDALLDTIRRVLSSSGASALTHTVTQALSGLGGIGKTALAAEYAYRHVADYDLVWWVRAEHPDTLAGDVAALATALSLPAAAGSQADAIAAVRGWLTSRDRWLLVFDNAERSEDVAPYLPGLRGHVLVTSRNPHWSTIATVVDVPPLTLDVAAELICCRTGLDDRDGARQLASKLDGIPKVLEVAAGMFIRGSAVSLSRFTTALGDGTAATKGVWDAAFDRALAVAGVPEILTACTVLDPDSIQVELLATALGLAEEVVEAATGVLRAQQILRRTVDGLGMHRLVQAAAGRRLGREQQRRAAGAIAAALTAIDTEAHPELLPFARDVQSHAPYVVAALGGERPTDALLRWYAGRLAGDGAYRSARDATLRALGATETILGPEHPDTGWCLGLLGQVLQDLGELAAARDAAERALAVTEDALGPDHADVARCYTILARILRRQAEMSAARTASERALAITEAAFGPDHPDVGRRLITLAAILREAGDPVRARRTAERAVAITAATLGADHPDTGWGLGVLAAVLHDLGNLDAARSVAERALHVTERSVRPDHPDLGWYLGVLAGILRDLGDLPAARLRAERALRLTEAALGPDHPNVGWDLDILATVLGAAGDLAGAAAAAERAVTVTAAALGPDHPDVGQRLGTLAVIRRATAAPYAAADSR